MPAVTSHETLIRQLAMLQLIPKSPSQITVSELTQRLEKAGYVITARSVQRDLNDIKEQLPQLNLVCNDSSKPYGWKWAREAKTYLHFMGIEEALTLYLVDQHLQKALPSSMRQDLEPIFHQAKQTLAKASDKHLMKHWLNCVVVESPTQPFIAPKIKIGIQQTIYQAVFEQKQLEVSYQGFHSDQAKSMILHPLGLLVRGHLTYLGATVNDYCDIRLFALHRFNSAQLKPLDDANPKTSMTWQEYLSTGAAGFSSHKNNEIQLIAWVDEYLARILRETPLSADQHLIEQEKGYQLSATVFYTWQLNWWILSQGARIKIYEPVQLKCDIYDELSKAKALYDE